MNTSNNIKAVKSGMWYTISNFLYKAMGFITTPIFTRLLTPSEFGEYSNFLSWFNILGFIVTLNLEAALLRGRWDFEEKFDEFILSLVMLSVLATAGCMVFLNCIPRCVTEMLDMNIHYANAMMIYIMTNKIVIFFQTRERFYFAYKATVITSMGLTIFTSFLSVVLVLVMENRLSGRIYGTLIPSIVMGIVLLIFFVKKGKKVDVRYWIYALPICIPYIPHLLSMTLLSTMDRVMITKMCGKTENALYSLAYTCGMLMTLFLTSLNNAFSPWLGEQLHEKRYGLIRKVSVPYILLFCYLAVGAMLIAPEILMILGGKEYMEAIYVMPPVAMACICQFLYTMFVNVEQYYAKTVGMAFASVSAAVLNCVLNIWLIPILGYIAAAYTTLIGYIWLLLVHMFLVYRMGKHTIYNCKFIIYITCALCIVMIMMNFMYNSIMRYIIIAVYIMMGMLIVCKKCDALRQNMKNQ